MRVSDNSFYLRLQRDLASSRERLSLAQRRASSGLAVEQPSDDPTAYALGRKQALARERAAGYERTLDAALSGYQVADSALGDADSILQRARELAVQGANDTLRGSERASLDAEVAQLVGALLAVANTQDGERYLFAGYRDGSAPFDPAGAYLGDAAAASVEVARGVTMPAGLTGDTVFGGTGGQDAFAALGQLRAALQSGVAANISQEIATLDASLDRVRSARAQLGTLATTAEITLSVQQRAQDLAAERHAGLVEIDAVDAYTDFARAQSALSAAVELAAQLPPPGLATRSR